MIDPLIDTFTVHLHDRRRDTMPHISRIHSNLYQGGCMVSGLVLPERFRAHVCLYDGDVYEVSNPEVECLAVRMEDSHDQDMSEVDTTARWIVERLDDGAVLVNCQAGLNRSGVVVARTLMFTEGMSADQAVETVRAGRSPLALCNSHFVAWLHEQD